MRLLSALITASVIINIETANILAVFPMPSISHQVVFRKLTQELAKRGHEIVVITPDPAFPKDKAPANLKEIDIHDISYRAWRELFQVDFNVNKNFVGFTEIRQMPQRLGRLFEIQLQTPEVKKIIYDPKQKFDLILLEALMRPALALSHVFKAPTILVSSLGAIFDNNKVLGSPTHPLFYPTSLHRRIYNLSYWEKLKQLYVHFSIEYALYLNEADENAIIQKNFGSDVPPLNELFGNVDMLFININPIWADNQPVPPSVIYMGGLHQIPEKELPKDLKTYMDSSKHGVIYLSFGTNVLAGMIPPNKIQMIIKVLSEQPYDVLWKWDKDELPGKSDNIKISKWFPQSDLLRHPKVKLFITQAGLQSTDEAITAGVPLVAVPMLGDQWYNAEKYSKHGIGINLKIETLTAEEFKNAIETVINDENYRRNIHKLRQVMRDQPETPLQRAVWWTEYVIRHGGSKHLRAATANVSYAQYFEIELLLVSFIALLLILVAYVTITIYLLKLVYNVIVKKLKVKKS